MVLLGGVFNISYLGGRDYRLSIFGVGPTTIKDPYFLDGVDSNQRKVQPYSGKSDFLPSLATADLRCWPADFMATAHNFVRFIELDDGKIETGPPLYFMVKTMVSCRFSLKPIH